MKKNIIKSKKQKRLNLFRNYMIGWAIVMCSMGAHAFKTEKASLLWIILFFGIVGYAISLKLFKSYAQA